MCQKYIQLIEGTSMIVKLIPKAFGALRYLQAFKKKKEF